MTIKYRFSGQTNSLLRLRAKKKNINNLSIAKFIHPSAWIQLAFYVEDVSEYVIYYPNSKINKYPWALFCGLFFKHADVWTSINNSDLWNAFKPLRVQVGKWISSWSHRQISLDEKYFKLKEKQFLTRIRPCSKCFSRIFLHLLCVTARGKKENPEQKHSPQMAKYLSKIFNIITLISHLFFFL